MYYVDGGLGNRRQIIYDAVVSQTGQYKKPSQAISAGHKRIFIRDGIYIENVDLNIAQNGMLVAQNTGGTKIIFPGGNKISIDGSARKITGGTISYTNGSTTINGQGTSFTSLLPGDWISLSGIFHQIGQISSDIIIDLVNIYRGRGGSNVAMLAQSMFSGAIISGIVVGGSILPIIQIKQAVHSVIQKSLVVQLASVGSGANIKISDSSGILCFGVIVQDGCCSGIHFDNCKAIRLQSCVIKNCGDSGLKIDGGSRAVIADACFIIQNDSGIYIGSGSAQIQLSDCLILQNNNIGIEGVPTSWNSIIGNCQVCSNGSYGLKLSGVDDIVQGCQIKFNGDTGVVPSNRCTITDNKINFNTNGGIDASVKNNIMICSNSITNNSGDGISARTNCQIVSNRLSRNAGVGINIFGNDNIINANRINSSSQQGIKINSGSIDCIVTSNNAKGNAGVGINNLGSGTVLSNNK